MGMSDKKKTTNLWLDFLYYVILYYLIKLFTKGNSVCLTIPAGCDGLVFPDTPITVPVSLIGVEASSSLTN